MTSMHVECYGRTLYLNSPSWEMRSRWDGTLSPEPETAAWIETMQPGEVFFDVGANVGRFSAMAACRGLKVFAFEPEAERYAELCRMVRDNALDVTACCVAVFDDLRVGRLGPGRSSHTFGESHSRGQGAVALPLDTLASQARAWPHHVKVDVDGNEPAVLSGAQRVLRNARSVLVEIDPGADGHDRIAATMKYAGFVYDPAQVEACTVRDDPKYAGMANWIFRRP